MKLKKWLAFGLAVALALSAVHGQHQIVSAKEAGEETEAVEAEMTWEDQTPEIDQMMDGGKIPGNTPSENEDLSDKTQSAEKNPVSEDDQDSGNRQDAEIKQDSEEKMETGESGAASPADTPANPADPNMPASDLAVEEHKQDNPAGLGGDRELSDETVVLEENGILKTEEPAENETDPENGMLGSAEDTAAEDGAGELETQAGDIAGGTDGNINWRIAADGKLTVSGTGDFTSIAKPWDQYREQIVSAEVHVSGMTDATRLFADCRNLESIDLSSFDTGNVTNMASMFRNCESLKSIDLSNFDTGNVTDMSGMFSCCGNLKNLDLSSFNTENVVSMGGEYYGGMFHACDSLTNLDVSNFNTKKVTNMENMFCGCEELTSLDVSSFVTSNITTMRAMFQGCNSLTSLNLNNFNTNNVTNMDEMFAGCSSLTELDLKSFNTSNVETMFSVFKDCESLKDLNVSNFNTDNVTNMGEMFEGCSSLLNIDIDSFSTENVTYMVAMFKNCSSLTSIDVSNFNTSNVTNMGEMFEGCSSIEGLDLSNFDTNNLIFMWHMFYDCVNLSSIDLSSFQIDNVWNMAGMFQNCRSLTSLDLSKFDVSNILTDSGDGEAGIVDLFLGCTDLLEILTPYNLTEPVKLPVEDNEVWYLPDGTEITELPQNLSYSVVIRRFRNPKIITTTPDLNLSDVIRVKYVPYSYTVQTDNWDETNIVTYSIVSGELAEGLMLYPATGEIYGIPLEAGEFPITVKAEFSNPEYLPSYADLTLTVLDNTDGNVLVASDPGYEVEQYLGTQINDAGSTYYMVQERTDQLFVSAGENGEFIDLWLNGVKLAEGEDFTRESGSTRITVRSQTLENKTNKDGINTLAAEFRVGGDPNNALKRTAQNFRINFQQGGSSGSGSHSGRGGSGGGSSDEGVTVISSATAVVYLMDTAGNPLTDTVLELHSTPQIVQTDKRGTAVFAGVTAGQHTLYVKDGAGNILAFRNFELLFGEKTSVNAEQVTVKAGAAFTLQVQMKENELFFLSIQEGDVYRVSSAGTGDDMEPGLWLTLLLLSCGLSCEICAEYRKRRKY